MSDLPVEQYLAPLILAVQWLLKEAPGAAEEGSPPAAPVTLLLTDIESAAPLGPQEQGTMAG